VEYLDSVNNVHKSYRYDENNNIKQALLNFYARMINNLPDNSNLALKVTKLAERILLVSNEGASL